MIVCLALASAVSAFEPGADFPAAVERFANALLASLNQPDPMLRAEAVGAFLRLAQGSNQPSAEVVRTFIDELAAATRRRPMELEQALRLGHDFHEVLHCAFLNESNFEAVLQDAGKHLRAAGASKAEAARLVSQLRAMADEVRERGRILDTPMARE